jgi:phage shock protein C
MSLFDRININRRSGLYRSRNGLLLGVCRGLAEYYDFSVGWVRFITLLAFIFTGLWPVGILYVVMALVMKVEPVVRPIDETEEEFYNSYAGSRRMAARRLKKTHSGLERRLRRLEDAVTSRDFDWNRKVRS